MAGRPRAVGAGSERTTFQDDWAEEGRLGNLGWLTFNQVPGHAKRPVRTLAIAILGDQYFQASRARLLVPNPSPACNGVKRYHVTRGDSLSFEVLDESLSSVDPNRVKYEAIYEGPSTL